MQKDKADAKAQKSRQPASGQYPKGAQEKRQHRWQRYPRNLNDAVPNENEVALPSCKVDLILDDGGRRGYRERNKGARFPRTRAEITKFPGPDREPYQEDRRGKDRGKASSAETRVDQARFPPSCWGSTLIIPIPNPKFENIASSVSADSPVSG